MGCMFMSGSPSLDSRTKYLSLRVYKYANLSEFSIETDLVAAWTSTLDSSTLSQCQRCTCIELAVWLPSFAFRNLVRWSSLAWKLPRSSLCHHTHALEEAG